MAVEIASAYVSIIPTTKGILGNLEKELVGPMNQAAKKAGDEAGATMKKSLADTGKSFTKFGIGALAVAGVIGAGMFKAGQAASDLGESVNAVKVTFGAAADGILKLGEDAATAVGLSNSAFNGLAVQFSSFASTIAGEGGDVVGTIEEMTGRAADFASVMNIDVAEAARLFQSGLAGETEPLKKFGIDLSAAAVNAFAAAHGIGEVGKELTESEKVTARYQLLMQETSKTQGDFANTADSAANASRIAKAELENASASIGAAFTPAIAFAAGAVADLAGKFVGLNDATGGWLAKGAGIAALAIGAAGGISVLIGTAIKMHDRFTAMKGAFTNAEGGLSRVGKAAKGAGLALGVLGGALLVYELIQSGSAAEAERFADSLDEINRASDTKAMDDFVASTEKWKTASVLGHAVSVTGIDLAEKMAHANLAAAIKVRDLAASHSDFAAQLEANGLTVEDMTKAIDDETGAQGRAIEATENGTVALDEGAEATDGFANATKFADEVIKGFAAATEEAKRKSDAYAESLVNQREKTEDLYGKEFDAIQAKHDLADATVKADGDVAAMNETLKSHKAGTEEATAATDAAYDSIVNVAEQYGTLNGAALGSDSSIRRQIDSLTVQAGQLAVGSPLRQALEQYIAELAEIPSKVDTQLLLNISMGQVTTAAGDLIGINTTSPGNTKPHARGGRASGRILVGEEGPELLDVPPGSFVYTAQQTQSMLSATSSLTSTGVSPINVHNYRRDIGVGDLNQILAMARLAA